MSSFLDLTLVIQLVHFACAYWILSKFFLRPVYIHIMHIQKEKRQMQQIIQDHELELAHEKEDKRILFNDMQHQLKESFPVSIGVLPQSPEQMERSFLPKIVGSQKELVDEMVQKIKQRIIDE